MRRSKFTMIRDTPSTYRALVFRPLVKGNGGSGNEVAAEETTSYQEVRD